MHYNKLLWRNIRQQQFCLIILPLALHQLQKPQRISTSSSGSNSTYHQPDLFLTERKCVWKLKLLWSKLRQGALGWKYRLQDLIGLMIVYSSFNYHFREIPDLSTTIKATRLESSRRLRNFNSTEFLIKTFWTKVLQKPFNWSCGYARNNFYINFVHGREKNILLRFELAVSNKESFPRATPEHLWLAFVTCSIWHSPSISWKQIGSFIQNFPECIKWTEGDP